LVDQVIADNKDLFGDTESDHKIIKRRKEKKRRVIREYLVRSLKRLKCAYPIYLCCFCLNPLECRKSLQAIIQNWFGILAAVTLVSLYWNTTLLLLFSENVGKFMFLGLGCLWTAIKLVRYHNEIASLGKNLEEAIIKVTHIEWEGINIIAKLDLANDQWVDCINDYHDANKEVRVAGRVLDYRGIQAETQTEQLDLLMTKYGGTTTDMLRRREAIDNLMMQQEKTLDQMDENVVSMHHEQMEFSEHAMQFKEDLEYLNETICTINKPLEKLESMKPNLHRMGADARECEAFLSRHIQYLSVLERITMLREMTYTQSIFFNALRKNGGEINEQLFGELLLRLPKTLRDAFDNSANRYRDYRCVLSKKKLGRTKYGGMDEASVIKFLKDLEAEAFQMEKWHSSNMPDPSRFGYDDLVEEESGETMQQHTSSEDIIQYEEEDEDTFSFT